jgi:hypothetical protein
MLRTGTATAATHTILLQVLVLAHTTAAGHPAGSRIFDYRKPIVLIGRHQGGLIAQEGYSRQAYNKCEMASTRSTAIAGGAQSTRIRDKR